jgi:hypothetical protein
MEEICDVTVATLPGLGSNRIPEFLKAAERLRRALPVAA